MKPLLQALVLADHVYEDKTTHKKIISGTFNQLRFKRPSRPAQEVEMDGQKHQLVEGGMQAGSPWAFISMVDVRGTKEFVLRYVDLDDCRLLLQTKFTVTCDDPLKTVEVAIPMPKLPTEKAGICALELLCDDEPLGSLRITVVDMGKNNDVHS